MMIISTGADKPKGMDLNTSNHNSISNIKSTIYDWDDTLHMESAVAMIMLTSVLLCCYREENCN
jgi:hypothetical protein